MVSARSHKKFCPFLLDSFFSSTSTQYREEPPTNRERKLEKAPSPYQILPLLAHFFCSASRRGPAFRPSLYIERDIPIHRSKRTPTTSWPHSFVVSWLLVEYLDCHPYIPPSKSCDIIYILSICLLRDGNNRHDADLSTVFHL